MQKSGDVGQALGHRAAAATLSPPGVVTFFAAAVALTAAGARPAKRRKHMPQDRRQDACMNAGFAAHCPAAAKRGQSRLASAQAGAVPGDGPNPGTGASVVAGGNWPGKEGGAAPHRPQDRRQDACMNAGFAAHSPAAAQRGQSRLASAQDFAMRLTTSCGSSKADALALACRAALTCVAGAGAGKGAAPPQGV